MATLKSLVDETTNIKNELIECHTDLKNFLSSKGINILNSYKMSSLIDIVKTFKYQSNTPIIGTMYLLYQYPNEFTNSSTTSKKMCEYSYDGEDGTLSFSMSLASQSSSSSARADITITRNSNKINVKTFNISGGSYADFSCNIDILKGDIISVWVYSVHNGYVARAKNVKITCDYLIV